jgi:hypothetical protein
MRHFIYFLIPGSPSNRIINQSTTTGHETVAWNEDRSKCIVKIPYGPVPDSLLDYKPLNKHQAQAEIDTWHAATKSSLNI